MMCKDEARVKLDFARHLEAVFAPLARQGTCSLGRYAGYERVRTERIGPAKSARSSLIAVEHHSAATRSRERLPDQSALAFYNAHSKNLISRSTRS
jgi:hypothetical protein